MPQQTSYEWEITQLDEYGDIQDPAGRRLNGFKLKDLDQEYLAWALDWTNELWELELVRFNVNESGGDLERSEAEVNCGRLPDEFQDGYKIPRRLWMELIDFKETS